MDLLEDTDLEPLGTFRGGWAHRAEYRLKRDLSFGGVTVPAGFVIDGYSLPGRWMSLIWQPKQARWMTPSTLHDWAYETMCFGAGEKGREQADMLLRRAMKYCGINDAKSWIVWSGVRLGGGPGYGAISPQNRDLVAPWRPDLRGILAGAGNGERRGSGVAP